MLLAAGWRASPGVKAALLGTAAGLFFGLSAALTKATVDQLDEGILHVFATWHLYGLLAVGYAGMTLSQMALQTGVLAPAIATFSILDAITSVVLGVTLFHETLRDDPLGIVLDVAALGVMFAGLIVLAGAEGARQKPEASPGGARARAGANLGHSGVGVAARVGEEDHQADDEPARRAGSRCRRGGWPSRPGRRRSPSRPLGGDAGPGRGARPRYCEDLIRLWSSDSERTPLAVFLPPGPSTRNEGVELKPSVEASVWIF